MNATPADKKKVADRFSRSLATYEAAAIIQTEMAGQLIAGVLAVSGTDRFENVLELGCGTGLLTGQLLGRCRIDRLVLNDLVPECEQTARLARQRKPDLPVRFLPGDMESIDFPDRQDLIMSNAVVQWADDPGRLLKRMAGLLRPGGVLALTSFGPLNLGELSRLTGQSLRYWSLAEWQAAMAYDFDVLREAECVRTLWFESAREVLRHLKRTGVNALSATSWPPAKTAGFCRTYEAACGRDGKIPLTYHPLILVARKRPEAGRLA